MRLASRDRTFHATVYATYTWLVPKGIYKQDEFRKFFVEWTRKEPSNKAARGVSRSRPEFS
jgi:hypothetical protein